MSEESEMQPMTPEERASINEFFWTQFPQIKSYEFLEKELADMEKKAAAYREIAIDLYCTDTNGVRKSWDEEATKMVDANAQELLRVSSGDAGKK